MKSSLVGPVLFPRLALILPLLATACGGRLDPADTGEAVSPAPVSAPSATTPFPSGTIAVGAEFNGATFYPRGAVADTPPLGQLTWSIAQYAPQYLAFDAAGALYVDSYLAEEDAGATPSARVDVFAPGSVGSSSPVRTIMGPQTGLVSTRAMVVDSHGYLYVANGSAHPGANTPSTVSVFAPDATGDIAPVRVIMNGLTRTLWLPCGLALSESGSLFVSDSEPDSVDLFPSSASGQTVPSATIGSFTAVADSTGIALGGGFLYVADWESNDVAIFDPNGEDAGAPVGVIAGDQTMLGSPDDIAVDADGRILVANQNTGLTVFAPGASGNVAPVTVIQPADAYNVAVMP